MIIKSQLSIALFAVLLMFSISSVTGNGSFGYTIKGKILNQETGAPIPLAEVFISGTTYGSISDDNGEFQLQTSYLPCLLVVSHISYAPFNMLIDAESITYMTIKLIPYEHEIEELTVESMNMRKQNLKLFKKAFLGTDEIAISCTILNDSVISFRWDSMVFSASAYQPVMIDNPKLGYRIMVIIEDFKLIYDLETYNQIRKHKKMKPDVAGAVYQILCNYHFIQYPQEERRKQKRIENTRLRVYYGSRMHFLRALYSENPKKHGYFVGTDFDSIPITPYIDMDSWPGKKIIFLDPEGYPDKQLIYPEESMIIQYYEDYSGRPQNLNNNIRTDKDWIPLQTELTILSKDCIIRSNGTTFDYSMLFTGYIGKQKIAGMLPDDFMLED